MTVYFVVVVTSAVRRVFIIIHVHALIPHGFELRVDRVQPLASVASAVKRIQGGAQLTSSRYAISGEYEASKRWNVLLKGSFGKNVPPVKRSHVDYTSQTVWLIHALTTAFNLRSWQYYAIAERRKYGRKACSETPSVEWWRNLRYWHNIYLYDVNLHTESQHPHVPVCH